MPATESDFPKWGDMGDAARAQWINAARNEGLPDGPDLEAHAANLYRASVLAGVRAQQDDARKRDDFTEIQDMVRRLHHV